MTEAAQKINWKDRVMARTGNDWQLFDGHDAEANLLNRAMVQYLEHALGMVADGTMEMEEAAIWVRDNMSILQNQLSGSGAADTEPDWEKVDIINNVLGTDIGRW